MAIKNIIAMGIGFTPGSVKYIPTLGFSTGATPPPSTNTHTVNWIFPSTEMFGWMLLIPFGEWLESLSHGT